MAKLVEYLTPTTLAQVCADIAEQAHEVGIDRDTRAQAEAFLAQGYALVGKEEFDQMVEDALDE